MCTATNIIFWAHKIETSYGFGTYEMTDDLDTVSAIFRFTIREEHVNKKDNVACSFHIVFA